MNSWELTFGIYPGVLIGIRTYKYEHDEYVDHVLYLPFVDLCLTVYKE